MNDPLDEAVALHEEAEALYDDGLYDDALDAARRSLFLFERHCGRDHPDTANVLLLVGAVHEDRSEYAEAAAAFERADDILDAYADNPEPILIRLRVKARSRLGGIRRIAGDLATADRLLRDAVELAEHGLGARRPRPGRRPQRAGHRLQVRGPLRRGRARLRTSAGHCRARLRPGSPRGGDHRAQPRRPGPCPW